MKTLTKKYELHLEAAITIGELDPETDIQYLIGVLEAIQMPETDALYNPENGWTGVVPIDYARDLERRLTVARETLIMIADESSNLAHAERMADRALKQTAPKP